MIGELTGQDALGPVIIEMHISLRRQEKGRRSEPRKGQDTQEENASKQIGGRAGGIALKARKKIHELVTEGPKRVPGH